MVSTTYSFTSQPPTGFSRIDFGLDVTKDPGNTSYFWADQVGFIGAGGASTSGDAAYIGLQPWGVTQSGSGRVREAIFSVFGVGTSSTSSTCLSGADTGAGTSCKFPFTWVANESYSLTIERTGVSTWDGLVNGQLIGAITVPPAWGNLATSPVAFTEYWSTVSGCNAIPDATVVNEEPYADGTLKGSATATHTYGSTSGTNINCQSVAKTSLLSSGEETNSTGGHAPAVKNPAPKAGSPGLDSKWIFGGLAVLIIIALNWTRIRRQPGFPRKF